MRKRLVIVAIILGVLALAVAVAGYLVYRGSQRVPEFYRQALEMDEQTQRQASLDMAAKVSSLVNDAKKEGQWQAVFTADEINAWLAVDAAEEATEEDGAPALLEHPVELLPPYLRDPRVAIEPDRARIACRFERDGWTSVLSLNVEIYLAEPDLIALRIRKVRAGAVWLPLPLEKIMDGLVRAAHQHNLQVFRRQVEGDPVIEVSIPALGGEDYKAIRLETLQLGEGKIYVAGSTERP